MDPISNHHDIIRRRHAAAPDPSPAAAGGGAKGGLPLSSPSRHHARRHWRQGELWFLPIAVGASLLISVLVLVAFCVHIIRDHGGDTLVSRPDAAGLRPAGKVGANGATVFSGSEGGVFVDTETEVNNMNNGSSAINSFMVQQMEEPKSFPPGCHWACYIDRHSDLSQKLQRTEEAATKHYVISGYREKRHCHCDVEKALNQIRQELPTFHSTPSSDSLCHTDKFTGYCKNITCHKHDRNVDEKLLASYLKKNTAMKSKEEKSGCKMLWCAVMHESDDQSSADDVQALRSYASYYSAAVKSALLNAPDSLEPILLLGRQGTMAENSTEHKELGRWAEAWGVKVFYSPRLSFHDHEYFREWMKEVKQLRMRQGPFLRLDVPKLLQDNNLLESPGVCKNHILYTDVDVIFANEITKGDVQNLAAMTGDAVAMYGRQTFKNINTIRNSGVMVMNVKQFQKEVPLMLDHIKHWGEEEYSEVAQSDVWDQRLVNNYKASNNVTMGKFRQLPLHYNWKPYWELEPSSFPQVKIIHFHGPKPGKVLDEIGKCNMTSYFDIADGSIKNLYKSYRIHFDEGLCCDHGRTADWSINAFNVLRTPAQEMW